MKRPSQLPCSQKRVAHLGCHSFACGGNKGYFSTYPNPSSGAFQVVLNNKEMLGSATLSIRDTKGASLLQRGIEVKPGINLFSINDLNLAPGVYYIQVINGDQTTEVIKEVIR